MTQIGTSPNIIVSRVREEITGQPFTMFDYHARRRGALRSSASSFWRSFYRLLPERARPSRRWMRR